MSRRWFYVPAVAQNNRAALYRIDNTNDSEMIVNIGNSLVSLGNYARNINQLKVTAQQINQGAVTDVVPTPIASLSINSASDTIRQWILIPPGENFLSMTLTGTYTGNGDADFGTAVSFGRNKQPGLISGIVGVTDNETTPGGTTGTGDRTVDTVWYSLNDTSQEGFGGIANPERGNTYVLTLQISNASPGDSHSGTADYLYTFQHRPRGYLSMSADGVAYCNIRYLDANGDLNLDYFIIQPTGSFSKTSYTFADTVAVAASDFRGILYNFVGFPYTTLQVPLSSVSLYQNFYVNSFDDPTTARTFFIESLIQSAASTSDSTFQADLRDLSFQVVKTFTFNKPSGAVNLLSAVGLA